MGRASWLHDTPPPRIVYHRTTAETINRVHVLMQADKIVRAGGHLCVLIDKGEGLSELQELVQGSEYRITVLCIATLHDDLLKQVRAWARMGYNAQNIQAELDYKFGEFGIYQPLT